MNFKSDWDGISARIKDLLNFGDLYYRFTEPTGSDYYGISNNRVIPLARDIVEDVSSLLAKYPGVIPPNGKKAGAKLILEFQNDLRSAAGIAGVQGVLFSLSLFRTEFERCLPAAEIEERSLVNKAFIHLQRSLVVDEDLKARWQEAFKGTKNAETECEKLGAVHLLGHGIWAFKAHAAGERTDLIMNEPVKADEVGATGTVMALTEWKIARDATAVQKKVEEAFSQAQAYKRGVLGGLELKSECYLIIVTEDRAKMPVPTVESGVTYKPINIAVNPSSPSKAARV